MEPADSSPNQSSAPDCNLPPEYKPVAEGFGGWLILPLLGLVASPLLRGKAMMDDFSLFGGENYPLVIERYPGVNALLYGEIVLNGLLMMLSLGVLICFAKKKAIVPKLMIALYLTVMIFTLSDAIAVQLVFHGDLASKSIEAWAQEIFFASVPSLIWIPYFLKSERVNATFIYP